MTSSDQQIERIREAQSVADLLRDWSDACGVEFDGIRQETDSRVTRLALEALVNEARAPLLARLEECERKNAEMVKAGSEALDMIQRIIEGKEWGAIEEIADDLRASLTEEASKATA